MILVLKHCEEISIMTKELNPGVSKSEQILDQLVLSLAEMVEIRDPYTAKHQKSVALLSCEIGLQMGLPDWQIKGLWQAASVHDIGKLYIPYEILTKPGKLSSPEFDIIKLHSQLGNRILKGIDFPRPVAQIVLQHHERLNGSGYPYGLLSRDILIEAKILSVVDVIEAMSTDRPYRLSLGMKAALEEISKNRSILYDADVVDFCLSYFAKRNIKASNNILQPQMVTV